MMRITLVALFLALFACGNTGDKGNNNAHTNVGIDDGKKIYKKYCIACHGLNGELALNGAKNFKESTLKLDERIVIISEGRKLMTPFKGVLNEDEIKAVAAYTLELSKRK